MQTHDLLRAHDLQGAVQTVEHVSSVVLILQVPPRIFQLEGDQTGNRCRMQAAGGGAHMLSRKLSYSSKLFEFILVPECCVRQQQPATKLAVAADQRYCRPCAQNGSCASVCLWRQSARFSTVRMDIYCGSQSVSII
jgi:hypothetical protein